MLDKQRYVISARAGQYICYFTGAGWSYDRSRAKRYYGRLSVESAMTWRLTPHRHYPINRVQAEFA